MKRKYLSIFTAAMLAVSSATPPSSISRTVTLLLAGATAFSTAFDKQAGVRAQMHAAKCVRVMSRSRVLGVGCFAVQYSYRGAVEVLKALGAHHLAKAIEEAGVRAGDVLSKPSAGTGIERRPHHLSKVDG